MSKQPQTASSGIAGMLLGPAFILLALWFVFGSGTGVVPAAQTPPVSAEQIDPSPRRLVMQDPPMTRLGGVDQKCNACHGTLIEPRGDGKTAPRQHTDIKFEHGINDSCYNCHDKDNRMQLRLYDGRNLEFADSPRLCAQCHGPVFRDWNNGTHGKTLGYWDSTKGPQRRLGCAECHDPHAPDFPIFEPLPAPNTLRMGDHSDHGHGHGQGKANPLGRWSGGHGGEAHETHDDDADHDETDHNDTDHEENDE